MTLGFIRCPGCDEPVEIGGECVHCGYYDPHDTEQDDAPQDHDDKDTDEWFPDGAAEGSPRPDHPDGLR